MKNGYKMTTVAQPGEVDACIDNIMAALIATVVYAYKPKTGEAPEPVRPLPKPEALSALLKSDLAARGWVLAREQDGEAR